MRYLLQHRLRGNQVWQSRWSLRCSVDSAKEEIDTTRYPNTEYRVLEFADSFGKQVWPDLDCYCDTHPEVTKRCDPPCGGGR